MRLPQLGRNRPVEFNVTPLIDVVFLLIIFFLVSSHLVQQETQVELALPAAASGREIAESKIARVTINLLRGGELLLGSESVEVEQVSRRLKVERRRTSGDLEVRIRADRAVPYRYVEPILVACVRAQIWNVSFAVVKHSEP
jgi:biopolymer transport protein ExbD